MRLTPRSRLGPYEVLGALGAGGMGEVYRAVDTRLGREVAVKVLRGELASQPDAPGGVASLERFEREARAIASLSHPNICRLYDVGHQDGFDFLVMELVQGETLLERLRRGPLPVEQALAYAIQVAGALDRAHAQGIVHRNLKPANIMLTAEGAKLLDFGLARLLPGTALELEGVTMPDPLTTEGAILGTIAYMAPEQLDGSTVDARADLFAFGAVLYEMLAGRHAFDGPSQAAVIGAILHSTPPPLETLRTDVPPGVARVIAVCLAKDPGRRWSSAHDVVLLLEGVRAETGATAPGSGGPLQPVAASASPETQSHRRGPIRTMWQRAVPWTVASLAVLAAASLAWRDTPAERGFNLVSIVPPPGTWLTAGQAPQVSPDGKTVAFVGTDASGRTQLYVRSGDSLAARPLPGTDDALLPFWAPDGQRIGFFARGSLKTVTLDGSRVQTLASATVPRGATWSRDDLIMFVPYPNDMPRWVPAGGGDSSTVPLPATYRERRWFPSFLPDGRRYLYLSVDDRRRVGTHIRIASLDSAEVVDLMPSVSPAVYVEPGYVLFRRDQAVMAQPFDPRSLKMAGPAQTVVPSVGFNPIGFQPFFSASATGVLAYLEPEAGWDISSFDRFGRPLGRVGQPGQYNSLCVTGDGKHVVYDRADEAGNLDIVALDVESGVASRLTFDPVVDFYPVCSPGGTEVVFSSLRSGFPALFRQPSGAPGRETPVTTAGLPSIPTDWSRDGKWVAYSESNPKTSWDIWILPAGGGKPFPFAATEAQERNAHFSPDAKWIAYTLQQGGSMEVYVQPFPPTGARWQVSTGGGRQPVWSPGGKELYYLTSQDRLMGVELASRGGALLPGKSRMVVETRIAGIERTNQGSSFAVSPDGQRLLVISAGNRVRPIMLVLNWTSLLR